MPILKNQFCIMATPTTLLIVDDDERCRSLLVNALSSEGYRLITADNGQEALLFAASHRPDAVLLDVMMPDMDGFEVCRLLRSDRTLTHLPVIFTTALDDRASRLKGIEAGADDFVTKPIDILELRTRLRAITRLNRFRLLSEERARFEQVVAASPDGLVIADVHGKVLLSNDAYRQLVPRPDDNFFEQLSPIHRANLPPLLANLNKTCTATPPLEITLTDRPRSVLELTAARLPWEGGYAFQFSIRDITEKKAIEAQLFRTQRIDLLGQLAGGIIHDVNNVLATIAAHAALINLGTDPEDTKQRLSGIESQAYHGGNLLRQLLLFARGRDSELKPVDPACLLCDFNTMAQSSLGKGIEVSIEVDPQCEEILGDTHQLLQVLMNLCINARDAMPKGGKIRLHTSHLELGEDEARRFPDATPGLYTVFSVSDNGSGIPPEIRRHLFEPFFTTKPEGKGTGLGLATVQRVIRRHGGFITLESTVGEGTSFHCHIPVHRATSTPGSAATAGTSGSVSPS